MIALVTTLAAQRRQRRQLPRPARRRADDLDAVRLRRRDAASCASAAWPRDRRGARQAPARDRGVDRHRRADQGRGRAAARGVPRAPQGGARPGRGDRRPRPQGRARSTSASRPRRPARKREELMAQARRDIEAETRRAIQEIRNEVADLTVMATEKVTRKTLTADDQERLVKEALDELDFTALAGEPTSSPWRRSPPSTPGRCSRSRRSATRSTTSASRSASSPTRCRTTATCRCSSSRRTSRPRRRRTGSSKAVDGADEAVDELPRAARREAPHAGDLPHPPRARPPVGATRTSCCP